MFRVGFLFNHYFIHQVPHAAPYAFELSRRYPNMDVFIACSSRQEMNFAQAIASLYPGHRCQFQKLKTPWYYRWIDPIISRRKFMRKNIVLRYNFKSEA